MRQAAPRVNLSESLGAVPGLQVQNRQNYAQDLQLSIRGLARAQPMACADCASMWMHSGHHARRQADLKY